MFSKDLRFKVIGVALIAVLLTYTGTIALPESRARPLSESPLAVPSPPARSSESPLATPSPPHSSIIAKGEEQLEAEIELRKSIGFRSDIEYIKAVHASNDVVINERLSGVAFTPVEASELEVRLNLEKDGDALLDFFEKEPEFQDAFGGIYIEHAAGSEDHTAGGKLVLQLVQEHERVNDIPVVIPPLQYPERLHIESVDFS